VRARLIIFVGLVQSVLILGHFFIYETWVDLWGPRGSGLLALRVALGVLCFSFVAATALAFRFSNAFVRGFYRLAATWLGLLNFLIWAACLSWVTYGLGRLAGWRAGGRPVVLSFLLLALVAVVYGLVNAQRIQTKRLSLRLPNLPAAWRGRIAALVSDLHLGNVHDDAFSRRIVRLLSRERPNIVFIAGDLYDGARANLRRLVEPWSALVAPDGAYFVGGNHEEFSRDANYLEAVESAGIRVLNNEKVVVDGMQIVGVHHQATTSGRRFEAILRETKLDPNCASILLVHSPHRLQIAEGAGISLQLSGHTHRGQMVPVRWIVERIFGPFAYGLHRFGRMMVYTSSGAGTWGPPMRVGTNSEIVLIRFE
jgi:uncharacterized protein